MEERSTLARPYANAVFKIASAEDGLDRWSEQLAFLASVTADGTMKGLLADPRIEHERLAELVVDIAGGRLTENGQNLVRVLAANGRLGLMDEIVRLYELERALAQRTERVRVISAYAVNAKFQTLIKEAMAKRLGCEVELETQTDRTLIGGIIIRAGDMVIDASLRGRLNSLAGDIA